MGVPPPVPPGPGKPRVLFAAYGGLKNGNPNSGWKTALDATGALQTAINASGDETVTINNGTMGRDPAHLVPKQFAAILEYVIPGTGNRERRAFACKEGETIDFTS
jgi:hypothetical protein